MARIAAHLLSPPASGIARCCAAAVLLAASACVPPDRACVTVQDAAIAWRTGEEPHPYDPPPPEALPGRIAASMDCRVDPCQDFYAYACGSWASAYERGVPEAERAANFRATQTRNLFWIRDIVETAAATTKVSDERRMLGEFYTACTSAMQHSTKPLETLAPTLTAIDRVSTPEDLMIAVAALHRIGVSALFDLGVGPHLARANHRAIWISPASLGLQQPASYDPAHPRADHLRRRYGVELTKMLTAVHATAVGARTAAEAHIAFETELATTWKIPTRVEAVVARDQLDKTAPALAWNVYFDALGVVPSEVVVRDPAYFHAVGRVLQSKTPAELVPYLKGVLVLSLAPHMSQALASASQDLAHEVQQGAYYRVPQWATCAAAAEAYLHETVARYYTQLHFSGEQRDAAVRLTAEVRAGFGQVLAGFEWLDAASRRVALEKLASMRAHVGHPEGWPLLTAKIDPRNHLANVLLLSSTRFADALQRVAETASGDAWAVSVTSANAYYQRWENAFFVPAGLLQAPMFDPTLPDVVNYAGIGTIIGHEIAHGFRARQFDGWQPAANREWLERSQCLARIYDGHTTAHGTKVHGNATLEESLADLLGVRAAWYAWRNRGDAGDAKRHVSGLTNAQLFFVTYAQQWCDEHSPTFERYAATTDPHAPHGVRVNATLGQMPEFADAFACEAGAAMRPEPACELP